MINSPMDLSQCAGVLFVGIGGGFDVYGAVPLIPDLKNVVFANFNAGSKDSPEDRLAEWLKGENYSIPVHTLKKNGVRAIAAELKIIQKQHGIDCIVCVDGGIDSIMTGDEEGAGTIIEDAVTMCAVSELSATKALVCLGFSTEPKSRFATTPHWKISPR